MQVGVHPEYAFGIFWMLNCCNLGLNIQPAAHSQGYERFLDVQTVFNFVVNDRMRTIHHSIGGFVAASIGM
jgi:hypothetical protein